MHNTNHIGRPVQKMFAPQASLGFTTKLASYTQINNEVLGSDTTITHTGITIIQYQIAVTKPHTEKRPLTKDLFTRPPLRTSSQDTHYGPVHQNTHYGQIHQITH